MRIDGGRLVKQTSGHCGNVERRAFGESESDRGELASYAIGWTSGHDERVGHMTIGIGVGNPGGGSFHIEIRIVDGEPGMRLVDGPFESVPQGGPDLTRAQALEHEDLPYVWFVADNVMAQDRRAAWMEHWLRGTRAFVTARVAEDLGAVRRVVRDQEGDWQLFDALEGDPGESRVTHLSHLIDADQSLLDVLDLGVGEEATRMSRDAAWVREVRG